MKANRLQRGRTLLYLGGFTLIELLVVMAVMSILTVITVSQFSTARARARDAARKGDLNAVSKALLTYFSDYGVFPYSTTDGQISLDGKTAIPWGGEFNDGTVPPYVYMKVLPLENVQGYPQYCYVTDSERKKFYLFAMLESKSDKECHLTTPEGQVGVFNQCGRNYCYSVVSPNAYADPSTGNLE